MMHGLGYGPCILLMKRRCPTMKIFDPRNVQEPYSEEYVFDPEILFASQPTSMRAPNLTENGPKVLEARYLLRDAEGNLLETPGGRFFNVARTIARGHRYETDMAADFAIDRYYHMMAACRFMPNSPTLMNAGKGNGLQLSACYVLPIEDSMEGIFETVKRTALVHKSGGGTGFSFSRLRPTGDFVGSTGGIASGPVSFMRVINDATEEVKQGGTRRGANMGILRIDHPSILEFMRCKRDLDGRNTTIYDAVSATLSKTEQAKLRAALLEHQISNFNISVAITDEFMRALEEGGTYALYHPRTGAVSDSLDAQYVWNELIDGAWTTGDPGLIFLDRMNAGKANPVPQVGPVESTNPCGEQPLYPNEACNLGSINLAAFVEAGDIRWKHLSATIYDAVEFLDGVISVNPYPDEIIDRCVKENRRIGLGVMGWADALIKLGLPYDSEEAVILGETVMRYVDAWAVSASEVLAAWYEPYPNWAHSIHAEGTPRRNSTVTTIAPTGTISIIAGCSSGIEPLFALCFDRKGSLDGKLDLETYAPLLEAVEGLENQEAILRAIYENGTIRGVPEIPERLQTLFATAHDITPEMHIKMQAAFQRYTENAVSKTINMPHDATREDVDRSYRLAYSEGCMGTTVYRDGCKQGVLHRGRAETCPECGAEVALEEGCKTCHVCGWSACGVGVEA
jgi:ribonucleoside-diphosphate reductase alpha chain